MSSPTASIADFFASLGLRPDKASFALADKLISGVKTALVGLVAYKGMNFVKDSISSVVEEGGKLADMSQTIGVSAEVLQEVGYAAQLSGGSLDSAAGLLKKFSKNVQSAADGSKEARKSLKEVGVNYKDILSGSVPLDSALESIADRFAKMPNGPKKVAMAMKLFGRSGADLIPLLNEGSEGIKRMRQEYRDLGGVIAEQDTKDLEAFGDATDKLDVAVGGLKKQIAVALLPVLSKVVADLTEWFKVNRKLIASRLTMMLKALITALVYLGKGFGVLVKFAEWLAPHWKLLTVIAGSLAIAMVLLGTSGVGAALASAAAWIAAAIPVIAYAAIIAAIILLVEDLWAAFNGGDSVMKDLYNSGVKWIGDKLATVIKKARAAIDEFLYGKKDNLSKGYTPGASDLWNSFKGKGTVQDYVNKRHAEELSKDIWSHSVKMDEDTRASMSPQEWQAYNVERLQRLDTMIAGAKQSFKEHAANPDQWNMMGGDKERLQYMEKLRTRIQGQVSITVNVPPGTDAQGVANAVQQQQDNWWNGVLRDTMGGK